MGKEHKGSFRAMNEKAVRIATINKVVNQLSRNSNSWELCQLCGVKGGNRLQEHGMPYVWDLGVNNPDYDDNTWVCPDCYNKNKGCFSPV